MSRPRPNDQVDERDTMFARAARTPGTPAYEDYYSRRPDRKKVDDRLRKMPDLCEPGGRHYEPEAARETIDWFRRIDGIRPDPQVVERFVERIRSANDTGNAVREMVLALGAVAVGFTTIDPAYVYSVKGRHDHDYGKPVALDHAVAIVFLVEMDFDAMRAAPFAPAIRESAVQYFRAAEISLTVCAVLRSMGRDAKAHYDAHYDVILPPLAVGAGLGELGRNNILIADRHGSRVRIGAVTTDLALRPDRPVDLGALAFCRICKKCAENCPSRSLSLGRRETIRGVLKWPTHVERCYGYWRQVGTDCGICMAVCPFSHENNRFHNLVRRLIRIHPAIARLALILDDLVYGRTWKSRWLRG